jgi:hypothetical protein
MWLLCGADVEDPYTRNLLVLWTSFFWPPENGWEKKREVREGG